MAEQYKKPYLESSVFIAWLKGECIPQTDAEGKVIECENRAEIARHILGLAEAGQFHVYTSTITITEVHKEKNNSKPVPEDDSKVIDFFRNGFLKVIDVDRSTSESAHRLCRKHGFKPYDAVHLACAVRAGCDVLLTWDSDLLKIAHDGITISKPQAIGQSVLDLAVQPEEVRPIVATVLAQPQESSEPQAPPEKRDGTETDSAAGPKLESPPGGDATPPTSDAKPQNGITPPKDESGVVSSIPPVEIDLPGQADAESQVKP